MTALERYIRLETTGLWRETPEAPPREVVVSFGKATLVLTDPSDAPLGHWALAGVQVTGRRSGATIYGMGSETLEIGDREMVAAIAEVTRDLPAWPRAAPTRRRWRRLAGPMLAVAALAAAVAAGPELLRRLAVGMVPPEQAEEIGDRMLLALIEEGGAICAEPGGQRVLDRIAARVVTPAPRIRVLGLGGAGAAALPGGTLVLDRAAVTAAPEAAELAQWIAAAGRGEDPVVALMRVAGPWANLRQVFTGDPGAAAIARAAAAVRAGAEAPPAVPAPEVPPLSEAEVLALRDICG